MSEEFEKQFEIAKREQELATLRAKEAEEKAQLAEAQKRVAEAAAERREQAFCENLRRELAAAGLTPNQNYEPGDVEAIIRSSFKFDIANDGTFKVRNSANGQFADTSDALRGWASDPSNRRYFDATSLKLLETPPDKLCKSQMSDAMKSAFISRHGLDQFSKLPLNPPTPEPSIEKMDAATWAKLPVARRSEIVAQMGEQWLSDMLRTTRVRR